MPEPSLTGGAVWSGRCPHCRHFAPTYEKLAQALKDDPDILVTRLDVTDEGIPEARHYPQAIGGPMSCNAGH